MNTKYIFITGGVVSSLGKGIVAGSLGRILKNRGAKVSIQKFDPYLNADPGKLSPLQHGEVFVTDDGAETDLDLGHYERFVDESLGKYSDITAGMVYKSVLHNEEKGVYEGRTVQVIPHITDEIKKRVQQVSTEREVDFVITEIGGTVGDIEGLPFLEAIRQIKKDLGRENVMYIHVTLLPYLSQSAELKTKPTQHSVKELRGIGIQPDLLIVRSEAPMDEPSREKIALFCDLDTEEVFDNSDADSIYEIPLLLEAQGLSDQVLDHLNVSLPKPDLREWEALVERIYAIEDKVTVAFVAKYVDLIDSYLSLMEALNHSGFIHDVEVEYKWIDAEKIDEENAAELLDDVDGIFVPTGYGDRGLEGMIATTKYSRETGKPLLALGMGMHAAIIDLLREQGIDAGKNSVLSQGPNDVIHKIGYDEDQEVRRVGLAPLKLEESRLRDIYGSELVYERQRSTHAFNLKYLDKLKKAGVRASGFSGDGKYLDAFELEGHPWFFGVQYHPEFLSRPTKAHPLISSFVEKISK